MIKTATAGMIIAIEVTTGPTASRKEITGVAAGPTASTEEITGITADQTALREGIDLWTETTVAKPTSLILPTTDVSAVKDITTTTHQALPQIEPMTVNYRKNTNTSPISTNG